METFQAIANVCVDHGRDNTVEIEIHNHEAQTFNYANLTASEAKQLIAALQNLVEAVEQFTPPASAFGQPIKVRKIGKNTYGINLPPR